MTIMMMTRTIPTMMIQKKITMMIAMNVMKLRSQKNVLFTIAQFMVLTQAILGMIKPAADLQSIRLHYIDRVYHLVVSVVNV
jgi:hypothetical protein